MEKSAVANFVQGFEFDFRMSSLIPVGSSSNEEENVSNDIEVKKKTFSTELEEERR